jgi:hypothetical protein
LTKLGIRRLQRGGKIFREAASSRAVLPTHGYNLPVGYLFRQSSSQTADLGTIFDLPFRYGHHPSSQQGRKSCLAGQAHSSICPERRQAGKARTVGTGDSTSPSKAGKTAALTVVSAELRYLPEANRKVLLA